LIYGFWLLLWYLQTLLPCQNRFVTLYTKNLIGFHQRYFRIHEFDVWVVRADGNIIAIYCYNFLVIDGNVCVMLTSHSF
jgi:hypothetical protein